MNGTSSRLLEQLREGLRSLYAERLVGMFVFGSYARGEADSESDLDVAVVVRGRGTYLEEVRRTSALVADLSLEHGITLCPIVLDEQEWLHGDTPFLANLREEGVAA